MSIQKLHYENISGTLVRREGLLSWRCPLCKAEGQSPGVMHTCPECGSKEPTLSGAQPAPSVPDGWLRAIDEALVTTHIGVANAHDTYEQAKAKLDSLIGFHVDVATDPAVNGGFKLMPNGWEANLLIVEHAMRMNNWDWNSNTPDDLKRSAYKIISNLLAAPEAK